MCEFCLNPNRSGDPDADHIDFAGFFSPDAIERAVQEANANRRTQQTKEGNNDDDDGT